MASIQEIMESMNNEHRALQDDEYLENDLIYCKKCNTPRTVRHWKYLHPCLCKCQAEEQLRQYEAEAPKRQAEKEAREKASHVAKVALLRVEAHIPKRYKEATFDNTIGDETFSFARGKCIEYCLDKQALDRGDGFYLYGTKGTGKTRLTACMANHMMDTLQSVVFTSFSEIKRRVVGEKDKRFERKLIVVDRLFIDDIGTERVKDREGNDLWLQEKFCEIVNDRYDEDKPVIYTSNYSLDGLRVEGFSGKALDRILEVSSFVRLDGESRRVEIHKARFGQRKDG